MTDRHPITPPPELVQQWQSSWHHFHGEFAVYIATQAAQWGGDQELTACKRIAYQRGLPDTAAALQHIRRPIPPTLKERIAAAITAGAERTALSLLNEAFPNG